MHIVKIYRRYGVQLIALDGIYGDSGTWRQQKPISPSAGRTMKNAHGTWKWKQIVKTVGTYQAHKNYVCYQLLLEEPGGKVLSLGFFKSKSLVANKYFQAFDSELGVANILDDGNLHYPFSNTFWTYTPQVDYCSVWIGPLLKIGGTLTAGGLETGVALLANTGTDEKAVVVLETSRYGAGLGGSFGVAIAAFVGFPSIGSMRGHMQSGWDFSVVFAENWAAWANSVKNATWFDTMRTTLAPLAKIKNITPSAAKQMDAAWDAAGYGGDVYKVVSGSLGKYADDNRSICVLDIPGLSKGLELAAYYSNVEVTDVFPY